MVNMSKEKARKEFILSETDQFKKQQGRLLYLGPILTSTFRNVRAIQVYSHCISSKVSLFSELILTAMSEDAVGLQVAT